jgi:hypothetical protein
MWRRRRGIFCQSLAQLTLFWLVRHSRGERRFTREGGDERALTFNDTGRVSLYTPANWVTAKRNFFFWSNYSSLAGGISLSSQPFCCPISFWYSMNLLEFQRGPFHQSLKWHRKANTRRVLLELTISIILSSFFFRVRFLFFSSLLAENKMRVLLQSCCWLALPSREENKLLFSFFPSARM